VDSGEGHRNTSTVELNWSRRSAVGTANLDEASILRRSVAAWGPTEKPGVHTPADKDGVLDRLLLQHDIRGAQNKDISCLFNQLISSMVN
jgi:hypothetical protein